MNELKNTENFNISEGNVKEDNISGEDNNVPSKTITVEKEVYEAVLRNSLRVYDLEEENAKLKERNDSLNSRDINLCRIANRIRDENFALKELLKECRTQLLNKPIREIQYDTKMAELKDLLKRIYEVLKW